MSHYLLERPVGAACRFWHIRAHCAPELVAPLACHRQRFGDLFHWGCHCRACHLTAATLLNRSGVPWRAAAFLAQYLVPHLIQRHDEAIWRIEVAGMRAWACALVDAYGPELVLEYQGRRLHHA